jgi:YfiH family protein
MIDLELPGARVRFTSRAGGVSPAPYASLNLGMFTDDDPARVAENIDRSSDGRTVALVRQVHGTEIREVDAGGLLAGDADGLLTTKPNLALLVTTADCLPVGLVAGEAVAMLHAGWRGLADGILEAGVELISALMPGARVHAAIGPGAGACCYEVGSEVAGRFADSALSDRTLDLKSVASDKLRHAGVSTVTDVQRCTMCEPEIFFSHRRSGPLTGRQGGLIWRA